MRGAEAESRSAAMTGAGATANNEDDATSTTVASVAIVLFMAAEETIFAIYVRRSKRYRELVLVPGYWSRSLLWESVQSNLLEIFYVATFPMLYLVEK